MTKAIILDSICTIKPILDTLKTKNGYSKKNEKLVSLCEKLIHLKNIGEQFEISRYIESDSLYTYYIGVDGKQYKSIKKSANIKDSDFYNIIQNLNACLSDRCFELFENKNHALCVQMFKRDICSDKFFVYDKNYVLTKSGECINALNGEIEQTNEIVAKHKRTLNDNELSKIKSAFNNMLGVGFDKPIFVINKKSA